MATKKYDTHSKPMKSKKPQDKVVASAEKVQDKVEKPFNIGEILRGRTTLRTYTPKEAKGKIAPFAVIPNLIIEKNLFGPNDEFYCPVEIFHTSRDVVEEMQATVILAASLGLKKGGWEFFLHAANHSISRIAGLYKSQINLCFKVNI